MKWTAISEYIQEFIREKVSEAGAKGVVIGLSGGVDSTVTAHLAVKALSPERVYGLILPEKGVTSQRDIEDARIVAERLKIQYREINIGDILECYKHSLEIYDPKNKIPTGNLKARIRMTVLYYHANSMNRLVAGTGNKTEIMVGYFTKYGDGGVDILPLGGLYKTEVYGLAEHLGVPDRIIQKTPTAGLWPGQTDEEEMSITYRELDSILKEIESGDDMHKISRITGLSLNMVKKVFKMVEESSHKRLLPPSAEIPDYLKEER